LSIAATQAGGVEATGEPLARVLASPFQQQLAALRGFFAIAG